MKRLGRFIKQWAVPTLLVGLAAALTLPWTFWVIDAAYARDVNEKSARLAERVKIQLANRSTIPFWRFGQSEQEVLEPIRAELLGDPTVQAVVFLNFGASPARGGFVRRNNSIPIPTSMDDIHRLKSADPNSYRQWFPFDPNDPNRGGIYLDLSRKELREHFWRVDGPLVQRASAQTALGIIVMSMVGIFAYRTWGRATRFREVAEMEQQGLLAERGLTAAVLAHEIRNPLQALRFQLHSLRRNATDTNRVANTADTLDAELMRIQNLVQDYLAHEKAQAMRVLPVSLREAVHTLQNLMSPQLRDTETRLIVDDGPTDVVVSCDPHALRQVLMNLVINAQQAMKRGGTVLISLGREDFFGRVTVADTGPGIPPEMKDRLFKPFQTSKKEGSGIGLALVKRFADNFGGSVAVESSPGQGASFHIRLPLAHERGMAEAPGGFPVIVESVPDDPMPAQTPTPAIPRNA